MLLIPILQETSDNETSTMLIHALILSKSYSRILNSFGISYCLTSVCPQIYAALIFVICSILVVIC